MMNGKKIYIIGIGGISMSALAIFFNDGENIVKGSDLAENRQTQSLRERGIDVVKGHSPEFVRWADEIIISNAIQNDDPDLCLARDLGRVVRTRGEALGEISKRYFTLSVAGSHGKTTTTGMISWVLLRAGKDPNIHVGGIMKDIGGNVYKGRSDLLVTEACEYKDSFLDLKSRMGVILNISPDHLDYFLNFDNLKRSFFSFAQNVNGWVVANGDDPNCREILKGVEGRITFGINTPCDFNAKKIRKYSQGRYSFACDIEGKEYIFNLPLFGYHNIYNALATISVCAKLGVSGDEIKAGVESFGGISRRFEEIYSDDNKIIIHDYAHHPDEIKSTILAGRDLEKGRIIAIFQPHTFSRTRDFFDGFCDSLSLADEVWMLPIYPAREKPIKGVSSYKIYRNLQKNGKKTRFFHDFNDVFDELNKIEQDSLVLIMGAGNIEKLATMFKK